MSIKMCKYVQDNYEYVDYNALMSTCALLFQHAQRHDEWLWWYVMLVARTGLTSQGHSSSWRKGYPELFPSCPGAPAPPPACPPPVAREAIATAPAGNARCCGTRGILFCTMSNEFLQHHILVPISSLAVRLRSRPSLRQTCVSASLEAMNCEADKPSLLGC